MLLSEVNGLMVVWGLWLALRCLLVHCTITHKLTDEQIT